MEGLDPAGEWRHLSEHYRQMRDDELVMLARQKSELTEVAQQALTQEISYRRLTLPAEETSPPIPEPDPESLYAEDRELVDLRTVWSLRDALQLQTLLDRAGIPFFMGPEKATGVDAVTSNFANGVGVQIMQIGIPFARQAMSHYEPADEPAQKPEEEVEELTLRCPKCRSADVVIGRLVSDAVATKDSDTARFEWTCDACGYEWEDDGVVQE